MRPQTIDHGPQPNPGTESRKREWGHIISRFVWHFVSGLHRKMRGKARSRSPGSIGPCRDLQVQTQKTEVGPGGRLRPGSEKTGSHASGEGRKRGEANAAAYANLSDEQKMLWSDDSRIWNRWC